MSKDINDFLNNHGLLPGLTDPVKYSDIMAEHMRAGLNGKIIDMPMIPTYLSDDGELKKGDKAIVIDAGGTNYRCAVAEYNGVGFDVKNLKMTKMPGTEKQATWDEFVCFVADSIAPVAHESDVIGFCFSYDAEITPEIDGFVHRIDKEVVITGCEGALIGKSVVSELNKRGIEGKRVIILNDTVAALLGGASLIDRKKYSDVMGMICGTGVNVCASIDKNIIGKISGQKNGKMLINLESGKFSMIPGGDIDAMVDKQSNNPGEKLLEKKSSGAYLGIICKNALETAVSEGFIAESVIPGLKALEKIDGSVVDSWANGEDPYKIFKSADDFIFVRDLCRALFERSARAMCSTILAVMKLNDTGKSPDRPMCVCSEGSLIGKSIYFRKSLEKSLKHFAEEKSSRYAHIEIGDNSTLPGSAVAAIIN